MDSKYKIKQLINREMLIKVFKNYQKIFLLINHTIHF